MLIRQLLVRIALPEELYIYDLFILTKIQANDCQHGPAIRGKVPLCTAQRCSQQPDVLLRQHRLGSYPESLQPRLAADRHGIAHLGLEHIRK